MTEPAAWTYVPVLARYWSPRIRAVLAGSIDASKAAQTPAHQGAAAEDAARQAVARAANPAAQRNLAAVLADLAADSYAAGTLAATEDLRDASWPDPVTVPGFDRVRWAARRGWAPGVHLEAARRAASIPASPGIARLITGTRSAAAGVLASTLRSAARALRRTWAGSAGPRNAQQAVSAVISSGRAYRITITAVVGALSAAAADIYRANRATLWDWVTTRGACPACLAKKGAGPYRLTDPVPPLHPGCQCATRPRASTLGSPIASSGIAGIDGLPGVPPPPTARAAEPVDPTTV